MRYFFVVRVCNHCVTMADMRGVLDAYGSMGKMARRLDHPSCHCPLKNQKHRNCYNLRDLYMSLLLFAYSFVERMLVLSHHIIWCDIIGCGSDMHRGENSNERG